MRAIRIPASALLYTDYQLEGREVSEGIQVPVR